MTMTNRLVAAIRRENPTLRWVEHHGVSRTGGNSGHYERDGTTRVTYDFGGNNVIVATHHPDRGESLGITGIRCGEWTIDSPSPFRPDSERTLVVLPMAA